MIGKSDLWDLGILCWNTSGHIFDLWICGFV